MQPLTAYSMRQKQEKKNVRLRQSLWLTRTTPRTPRKSSPQTRIRTCLLGVFSSSDKTVIGRSGGIAGGAVTWGGKKRADKTQGFFFTRALPSTPTCTIEKHMVLIVPPSIENTKTKIRRQIVVIPGTCFLHR